ncbi:MAG: hypothetical protein K2X74_16590 [Acetobacteraceae bacterium]|nr:hypothetical protein [Acetobacteraceae bacterium]
MTNLIQTERWSSIACDPHRRRDAASRAAIAAAHATRRDTVARRWRHDTVARHRRDATNDGARGSA